MRQSLKKLLIPFFISIFFLSGCLSSGTTPPAAETEPAGQAEAPGFSDEEARQAMYALSEGSRGEVRQAHGQVLVHKDQRFIAVFLELIRINMIGFPTQTSFNENVAALEALSGESFGADWPDWVEWYGTTDLVPPPGFTGWKGQLLSQIDPGFGEFLQDGFESNIRVEEILWGGVTVDGIPALQNADMIPAGQAEYLDPDEPVFGVSINGDSRAYPLRILDWHEMANDVVGGVPVSLAYCTLCGAGIAFDGGSVDGQTLTFGSSGFLYRSNKLMYDHQTRTLWNQLTGEPVLGPLVGQEVRLELLPVVVTTWADWQAQHPDTQVLSLDTGYDRTYEPGAAYGDYFSFYDTMFPVWQRSDLLATKDRIYALQIDGQPVAYPVDILVEEGVVNDEVGETELVVIARRGGILVDGVSLRVGDVRYEAGGEVRSYERGGHTFSAGESPDVLLDENGGEWTVSEEALIGPAGESLPRISGHLAYWFGWYAFFPKTIVYGVETQ